MNKSDPLGQRLARIEQYVAKVEDWDRLPTDPVVSVCMLTFNHEEFIGQAIEGVVKQVTDFPYELIIAEDKSTDRTREIVLDYRRRYPEKLRLRLARENLYSKNKRYPILGIRNAARGKYLAVCEGDDYWTDPYKLKKQVDFLEANDEYVLSFHNARVIDEEGRLIKESKLPESSQRDFDGGEMMKGAFLLTLSLCYRNVLKDAPAEFFEVLNGDKFLISLLGQHGKAKYQGDIEPAVYRKHSGGVWSALSDTAKRREHFHTFYQMAKYYNRTDYAEVADFFYERAIAEGKRLISHHHENGEWVGQLRRILSTAKIYANRGAYKSALGFMRTHLYALVLRKRTIVCC